MIVIEIFYVYQPKSYNNNMTTYQSLSLNMHLRRTVCNCGEFLIVTGPLLPFAPNRFKCACEGHVGYYHHYNSTPGKFQNFDSNCDTFQGIDSDSTFLSVTCSSLRHFGVKLVVKNNAVNDIILCIISILCIVINHVKNNFYVRNFCTLSINLIEF